MIRLRYKMKLQIILMILQTRLAKLRRLEMDVGANVGTGVVIVSTFFIIVIVSIVKYQHK